MEMQVVSPARAGRPGRVDGKVALVTGAARGQGRAHAIRLAEEGADIIAFDLCAKVQGSSYDGATEGDLAETVAMIERLDRRIVSRIGDLRNVDDVEGAVRDGIEELGHIDVLVANAGVTFMGRSWEMSEEDWATQIGINLTGSWRTAKAVIPHMIEAKKGGSIIFTTSGIVARGFGNMSAYAASKTGLQGLCRELAVELGPYGIRVNTLQPTSVNTVMIDHQAAWEMFTPGKEGAPLEERRQEMLDILTQSHLLETPWVESEDLANGVLFLASDESRMVTGAPLVIDAGLSAH
jgi:(+)-trans-carveol dehydrogenase